jgi:hypothetical protein
VVVTGDAFVPADVGADNPVTGDHANVAVPTGDALSATVLPAQITVDVGVTFTTGSVLTVTVNVCVSVHPFASVPVSVYVVVLAGATVNGLPLSDPGIQSYVTPPDPVSTVESPTQSVAALAVAKTLAAGATATVTVAVLLHPGAFVPVTVYVVVADGLTITEEPVNDPGIHR